MFLFFFLKPNVTNIDLREVKDENNTDTFDRAYTQVIEPFEVLRFSNWMVLRCGYIFGCDANYPDANVEWSKRRPKTYYTQVGQLMVSIEYMIELANLMEKDIWLSIPTSANDSLMLNMAK